MPPRSPGYRGRVDEAETGPLLGLTVAAAIVGLLTGAIVSALRWVLFHTENLRGDVLHGAHTHNLGPGLVGVLVGFLGVAAGGAVLVALAATLVRRIDPNAEGSGVPRIEAEIVGTEGREGFGLVPVKFVGTVLAIGAGMPVGRGGPSVHMGSATGDLVATLLRRSRIDARILCAAGAGAGLAAAFSAPIAGAAFVLEGLFRRFDTRITLATFATSAASIGVVHLTIGTDPALRAPYVQTLGVRDGVSVACVGLLAAAVGLAFNRAVVGSRRFTARSSWPIEAYAALAGALVATIGWFAPHIVGARDSLIETSLLGRDGVAALAGILAVRLLLALVAHSVGTPGGLFTPMYVLGALSGALVARIGNDLFPGHVPSAAALGIVGIAALFAACVRAPLTAVVLATELTGAASVLPPAIGACAIVMFLTTRSGDLPLFRALPRGSVRQ